MSTVYNKAAAAVSRPPNKLRWRDERGNGRLVVDLIYHRISQQQFPSIHKIGNSFRGQPASYFSPKLDFHEMNVLRILQQRGRIAMIEIVQRSCSDVVWLYKRSAWIQEKH